MPTTARQTKITKTTAKAKSAPAKKSARKAVPAVIEVATKAIKKPTKKAAASSKAVVKKAVAAVATSPKAAKKTAKAAPLAPQKPARKTVERVRPAVAKAPAKASAKASSKALAKAALPAPVAVVKNPARGTAPKKNAPKRAKEVAAKRVEKAVVPTAATLKLAAPPEGQPKAKRARVPKDLATQYGEKEKRRPATESAAQRKARRDAAARQKMREAMEVGDDVVARLRRAGLIGGDADAGAENGHAPRRVVKNGPVRRPRKWEARCGKCGVKGTYKSQAGLCARCGAILMRV